jgi:hypothetical protein
MSKFTFQAGPVILDNLSRQMTNIFFAILPIFSRKLSFSSCKKNYFPLSLL